MNTKWVFETMEQYRKAGIPFVAYTARNNYSDDQPKGCGIFRLDVVPCVDFDKHDNPITVKRAFTMKRLKKLTKSFKNTFPEFYAFLPDSYPKREDARKILADVPTTFLGEDYVSNDKHGEIP